MQKHLAFCAVVFYNQMPHCVVLHINSTEHDAEAHIWLLFTERLDFNRTNESVVPGEHRMSKGGCSDSFCCLRDDVRVKTSVSLADL